MSFAGRMVALEAAMGQNAGVGRWSRIMVGRRLTDGVVVLVDELLLIDGSTINFLLRKNLDTRCDELLAYELLGSWRVGMRFDEDEGRVFQADIVRACTSGRASRNLRLVREDRSSSDEEKKISCERSHGGGSDECFVVRESPDASAPNLKVQTWRATPIPS